MRRLLARHWGLEMWLGFYTERPWLMSDTKVGALNWNGHILSAGNLPESADTPLLKLWFFFFSLKFCDRVWHSMWLESASGDLSRALGSFGFRSTPTLQSLEMAAGQFSQLCSNLPVLLPSSFFSFFLHFPSQNSLKVICFFNYLKNQMGWMVIMIGRCKQVYWWV